MTVCGAAPAGAEAWGDKRDNSCWFSWLATFPFVRVWARTGPEITRAQTAAAVVRSRSIASSLVFACHGKALRTRGCIDPDQCPRSRQPATGNCPNRLVSIRFTEPALVSGDIGQKAQRVPPT